MQFYPLRYFLPFIGDSPIFHAHAWNRESSANIGGTVLINNVKFLMGIATTAFSSIPIDHI